MEQCVYLYDGHGSVVGLANESGKVTDTYCYDAFGNLLKSTGTTANNYMYCSEQFDETTGLYYLRARYMDTATGRFISQDSYAGSIDAPVSLHKYLYANPNPVMYSDPSGYASLADHLAALKGQAELAIAEIMHNQTAMAIFRSIMGGIVGASYAFCDTITKNQYTMEELWLNVIVGAVAGMIFGYIGGLIANRIILMFLGGVGVLFGAGSAIDSFANGQTRQGGFRAATTVLGAMAWWKQFGVLFKNVWTSIFGFKNIGNFRNSAIDHIFYGEISKKGSATGYHYEGMPGSKGEVIPGTKSVPNLDGVYEGKVTVNGVSKTANKSLSSFFPEKMSAQEVVNSINQAYNNKIWLKGNTLRGIDSNGMVIEMYIDNNTGKIISAFPVY